jgi:vesicle coat complex subunit
MAGMIRLREIVDPDLRRQITEKLAEQRGLAVAAVPDWYELDDADYVDLLNELKDPYPDLEPPPDHRM